MKTTLLGAALAFALFFVGLVPAYAQACYDYDMTIAQLRESEAVTSGQMGILEIPADKLDKFVADVNAATGLALEGVTRAFVFVGPRILVGVEINGCLLDPIEIVAPINSSMSGKLPDGRAAA